MAERRKVSRKGAAAKWARRVERLKRSGLSIRTFAAREGLSVGSLSRWKCRLERESGFPKFIELKARATPEAKPSAAEGFEVVLGSGRLVRVSDGFDAAELGRLVTALEEVRP